MLNFFCLAVSKNAYFCLFCVYIFSQGIQHFLDLTKNMQNFGKFFKIFSFCRIPLNKISFPAANAEAKYWFITLFSNLNEVKKLQNFHDSSRIIIILCPWLKCKTMRNTSFPYLLIETSCIKCGENSSFEGLLLNNYNI